MVSCTRLAAVRVAVCILFLALPYLALLQANGILQIFPQFSVQEKWKHLTAGNDLPPADPLCDLRLLLEHASTPDGTVIITTLNEAWAAEHTMIDLFLESFREGENITHLLDHLVIVTLDAASYARCVSIHRHCFSLITDGVDFSGEKLFMTVDYLKMMWLRIELLQRVLELGFNFIFTDADIMWFRDPFPRFHPDSDFQIACDLYNGRPTDLHNRPNGGFVYVRSNARTVELYKYWYASRLKYPQMHDQDVLNEIKGDDRICEIGVQISFLDTLYFGGFCQVSKDLRYVCTMHANCCTSLERKLQDLRTILEDWQTYRNLTPLQRNWQKVSWRAPKECTLSW